MKTRIAKFYLIIYDVKLYTVSQAITTALQYI